MTPPIPTPRDCDLWPGSFYYSRTQPLSCNEKREHEDLIDEKKVCDLHAADRETVRLSWEIRAREYQHFVFQVYNHIGNTLNRGGYVNKNEAYDKGVYIAPGTSLVVPAEKLPIVLENVAMQFLLLEAAL